MCPCGKENQKVEKRSQSPEEHFNEYTFLRDRSETKGWKEFEMGSTTCIYPILMYNRLIKKLHITLTLTRKIKDHAD